MAARFTNSPAHSSIGNHSGTIHLHYCGTRCRERCKQLFNRRMCEHADATERFSQRAAGSICCSGFAREEIGTICFGVHQGCTPCVRAKLYPGHWRQGVRLRSIGERRGSIQSRSWRLPCVSHQPSSRERGLEALVGKTGSTKNTGRTEEQQ